MFKIKAERASLQKKEKTEKTEFDRPMHYQAGEEGFNNWNFASG